MLKRKKRVKDIIASQTEVAEGVETAFALEKLIKTSNRSYRLDLKFPIILGVVQILRGKRTPREGLEDLMLLPIRPEFLGGPDHSSSSDRRQHTQKRRAKSRLLAAAAAASADAYDLALASDTELLMPVIGVVDSPFFSIS